MASSKRISLAFCTLSTTFLILLSVAAGEELYYTQSQLLDDIFEYYDETCHPSVETRTPVNVTLGIAVTQIVRVDEKSEGMNLNVWYRMKWKDNRLIWDPQKYENISEFMINSDYLWIPDIMLLKPLSSDASQVLGITKDEADLPWKILVHSDGTISFNFPGIINGQCPLNIANYPFDEHKCSFQFTSWVHDQSEINLSLREGTALDFSNYVLNNEWHILESDSNNVDMKYDCCPNIYKTVVFYVDVRRGASSYISNYIIPSILIIILSLMMFTLPPEVGKRMEIGINLLLCLSVYLTILNTKMPTRSDVFPLLSKFYGCCIFILTIALLCTCWVVAYYFHDMSGWKIYKMPKFVQIGVLYYLARLMRFPRTKQVYNSEISVDSGDGRKIINVKSSEQTKGPGHNTVQLFSVRNKTTKDEDKKNVSQDQYTKVETKVSIKNEAKNKKHENSVTDKTSTIERDVKEKEKKGIIVKETKLAGKENQEKIKDKKKSKKLSKEETDVKIKEKDVMKEGKDVKKKEKSVKKEESDVMKGEKDVKKEEKDLKKEGKDVKKKEKNVRREGKDVKREEKDVIKGEKNVKKEEKDVIKEGKDVKKKEKDIKTEEKDVKREDKDVTNEEKDVNKEEKDAKKEGKDVKKESRKAEKLESVEMNVVEKKHKDAKNDKDCTVKNNDIVKDEKKVISHTEAQIPKDKTTTDNNVGAENGKTSRSKESKKETMKKTNHVFANAISPGIVESTRKPRNINKVTKDIGVANQGADIKEFVQNETENTDAEKKHGGNSEKQASVRGSPSLLNDAGDPAKPQISIVPKNTAQTQDEVDCFDMKTTTDLDFESKQKKKRHESIQWLSELAEYYADHLQRKNNRFQWRQAAIILNRLFTILLIISIAFCILVVFGTR